MRLQDQLRNFAEQAEANQAPITVEEVIGDALSTAELVSVDEVAPHANQRRLALAAAIVALVIGLGVFLMGRSGDDPQPIDTVDVTPTPQVNVTPTPEVDLTPTVEVDEDAAGTVMGDAITFEDGGTARINSVTPNAAPRNNSYDPPGPDTTNTEIEIERCAGTDSTPADPTQTGKSIWFTMGAIDQNADLVWWTGVLDDGTEVPARPGYWLHYAAIVGGCSRGYITFATPDGTRLVEVVLKGPPNDSGGRYDISDLVEFGRWDVTRSRRSSSDASALSGIVPDAVELGEPMELRIFDEFTATVLSVTDNASPQHSAVNLRDGTNPEPPKDGRKLTEIRAEVCRKQSSTGLYLMNELLWLITTTDNYTANGGGETANGYDPNWSGSQPDLSTGLVSSLAVDGEWFYPTPQPGKCIIGTVQIDLPEEAVPAYVIVAWGDYEYEEIGRTRLPQP